VRGFAFTLMTAYLLFILLAIYAAYAVIPQMPSLRSYVSARDDAVHQFWSAEYNGGPEFNNTPQGGCIDLIRVIPYNEGIGKTSYNDLNEMPKVYVFRWCSP
jgi:hypothetical protein